LVVSGCVMMRVCHLDTCPVGIATQNPELRKRFNGKPEFVINFFEFIAQEVREYLAQLGFRNLQEAVGHVEALDMRSAMNHWKAQGLDISPILMVPENPYGQSLHQSIPQDHGLEEALDQKLLKICAKAISDHTQVIETIPISNTNRTVGTMLGHAITSIWGGEGLPDATIQLHFVGSAGQSFGAFIPRGIQMRLEGDSNDYLGKGLSGGRIIGHPHSRAVFSAEDNVIAGNVIAYGATAGEIFLSGIAGERFCVRNSGATAVVEGIGDHGCEYMTGGRVVVLGDIGRNFAAGMSGGIAFLYDPTNSLADRVNYDLVSLQEPDADDLAWLFEIITRHRDYTGSNRARKILTEWDVAARAFRKVMPRDYERVLAVLSVAAAEGLSEDATSQRVMASARG
ncbi:MAG: glutamate synthase-related protein, partial [Ilumatobacteraceae bacterium]